MCWDAWLHAYVSTNTCGLAEADSLQTSTAYVVGALGCISHGEEIIFVWVAGEASLVPGQLVELVIRMLLSTVLVYSESSANTPTKLFCHTTTIVPTSA